MNWQDLGVGIALLLVFEGILPFLSPKSLREAYLRVIQMDDNSIRYVGLGCMSAGLALLYFIR